MIFTVNINQDESTDRCLKNAKCRARIELLLMRLNKLLQREAALPTCSPIFSDVKISLKEKKKRANLQKLMVNSLRGKNNFIELQSEIWIKNR